MKIGIIFKTALYEVYQHKILWGVLYLLSFFCIVDIPGVESFGWPIGFQVMYLLSIAAFKATVISLILSLFLRRKCLRWIVWFFIVIYGLYGLINASSYVMYGYGISRQLIIIVLQTNKSEICEIFPLIMLNLWNLFIHNGWLYSLVIIAGFALLYYSSKKIFIVSFSCLSLIGLCIYACVSILYSYGRTAPFMCLRLPKYTMEALKSEKEIQKMISRMCPLPHPETVSSSCIADVCVMVIGESASKYHWSAYGYPLCTTPKINSMSDSLFLYSDAIASSISTAHNLERILTFKQDDSVADDWYKYPSIVDMFKTAGYKVFWLSNQERVGLFSNASGALASHADVVKYLGPQNSEDALIVRYDGVILPEFHKALNDTCMKKLIILHLMGSHVKYKNRYPKEYSKFTETDVLSFRKDKWIDSRNAKTIAEYDNSIIYTDSILGNILSSVAQLPSRAVALYFSDHGEDVYDTGNVVVRNETSLRIPFLLYANYSYRVSNKDIVGAIQRSIDYPISSANIVYPLMTITGTNYYLYDKAADWLSDDFIPRTRMADEKSWRYDEK